MVYGGVGDTTWLYTHHKVHASFMRLENGCIHTEHIERLQNCAITNFNRLGYKLYTAINFVACCKLTKKAVHTNLVLTLNSV